MMSGRTARSSSDNASVQNYKPTSATTTTTRTDVYKAFGKLGSSGEICKGGTAEFLPSLPGLYIEKVGLVPFPMTRQVAQTIKHAFKVPNNNFNHPLQLGRQVVKLCNPSWNDKIQKRLASLAADELCGERSWVPCEAKFDKLVLIEEGGSFEERHQSTNNEQDEVFAKIVVQLPSVFTGGDDMVTYNGKSQTISLNKPETTPYHCQYLAYYTDCCTHKTHPVSSGYRVMLVYSLCFTGKDGANKKPMAKNTDGEGRLISRLERLNKDHSLLVFPLKHRFSWSSLEASGVNAAFKGLDRTLANTIGRASGWEMIIGSLCKVEEEYGYEEYGYYGSDSDFEVCEREQKDLYLESVLYYKDGRDATIHHSWLKKQLDLRCVTDGGMVLAFEDLDMNWILRDSCGWTGGRERSYGIGILIAFPSNETYERLCQESPPKKSRSFVFSNSDGK